MAALLARIMMSRHYVPVSVAVAFLLMAGTTVAALTHTGAFPLDLPQSHSHITITGPGVASTTHIQAYILGAVRAPGVYTLTEGARIHDLIEFAGGALSDADLSTVNLAAVLTDGMSVYVPHSGETVPIERGGKIDLNAATAQQLHDALGISLTTARHIVAYRASIGGFTAVSQLLLVPISRTIYDRIKDLVTV
jgi:competence protein ComEA